MAEDWYALKSKAWAPTTAVKTRFYLDKDLLRRLGARPIAELSRRDLVDMLAKIEDRGAHDAAKKCRQYLSGIFRHALGKELIETNPATDLDILAVKAPPVRHHAHLPLSELPGLLRALDVYAGEPVTIAGLRLLLITACRPGELRFATWQEFDLDGALWTIPAERMKMRRPHRVPLPVQAVEILRDLHPLTGADDYVLALRGRPLSENGFGSALNKMGYKGRQTAHGFRHLISTALNERGYNRDWIERQLAHGDENEIRAVYNKAEYLQQRRDMMGAWADYLDSLKRGAAVVPLRRA